MHDGRKAHYVTNREFVKRTAITRCVTLFEFRVFALRGNGNVTEGMASEAASLARHRQIG